MIFDYSLSEIKEVASQVYDVAKARKVWAIHGEMGAGKTTFIHALCENLGVTSAIGSPTYAIINEYESELAGSIYHMDWYRLKDEEEALQAGVEDTIQRGGFTLIEWADKFPELLPENCLHLYITSTSQTSRQITLDDTVS